MPNLILPLILQLLALTLRTWHFWDLKRILYIHQRCFLLAEVEVQHLPHFVQYLKSLFRSHTIHNCSWLESPQCFPMHMKLHIQPKAQRYHMIFFSSWSVAFSSLVPCFPNFNHLRSVSLAWETGSATLPWFLDEKICPGRKPG